MLLLHIVIALASVAAATLLIIAPSARKLSAHYALIAATLGTGTYLIFEHPSHMAEACVAGVLYIAFAGIMAIVARNKLAAQKMPADRR